MDIDDTSVPRKAPAKLDYELDLWGVVEQITETEPYSIEFCDKTALAETIGDGYHDSPSQPLHMTQSRRDPNLIFNLIRDIQSLNLAKAESAIPVQCRKDAYFFVPHLVRLAAVYERWGFRVFRTAPFASRFIVPFVQIDTETLCAKVLHINVPKSLQQDKKLQL